MVLHHARRLTRHSTRSTHLCAIRLTLPQSSVYTDAPLRHGSVPPHQPNRCVTCPGCPVELRHALVKKSRAIARDYYSRALPVWAALAVACGEADGPSAAGARCGPGDLLAAGSCRPADAQLRPRVQRAQQGRLSVAGGWARPWMVHHPVDLELDLDVDAQPFESAVAVSLLSPARGAVCLVGSLPVRHGEPGGGLGQPMQQQSHHLSGTLVVPARCAPLVGATDVAVVTRFDASHTLWLPERDDHLPGQPALRGSAADPSQRLQRGPCAGAQGSRGHAADLTCGTLAVAASAGIDVKMGALQLSSSVAVVEYAGPALRPVAERQGKITLDADGNPHTGLAVGKVDPAEHAPTLADTPAVTAGLGLTVGGLAPGADATALQGGALALQIRPATEASASWADVEHQAVHAGKGVVQRAVELPVTAEQLRKGTGLAVQMALPDRVVEQVTVGAWKDAKLFELRVCLRTAQSEHGPDADATVNNCQVAEFTLVRVRKDSGLHVYPPKFAATPVTKDYFELGSTTLHPIGNGAVLKAKVFRGGYREVENGHVRLGAKTWVNLIFFPGPLQYETTHVAEAGAFHDVAPIAQDFVSGFLTILSLYTLDLPKYDVPEQFKFALNATADTKGSPNKFDGTANLGPLVDALNFVASQAKTDGLKWCFFDVKCIEPPFQAPVSLKLGLALVKGTTVPKCDVVPNLGCYLKQGATLEHFWSTAKTCADIAADLPADRGDVNASKALRGLANKWATPFYLGLYRPGNDYIPFNMLQVFFEKGWGLYGTPFTSTMPTFWAQLDATIEPENGACAAIVDDASAKFFKPNWNEASVSVQLKTKPYLADQAAHAHVGCEAKLTPVCEYPVVGDKVAYENSEIYVQQTGSITVDGVASYSYTPLDTGVVSLNALKATLTLSGFVMKVTWAATAGLRWATAQNAAKKWRVKGSNFADVKVTGEIGKFTIGGEGCVFLGLPAACLDIGLTEICTPQIGEWECIAIDLGGLTDILPTVQGGVSFSVNFLPFDVIAK